MTIVRLTGDPIDFELFLPPITLEAGGLVEHHVVRGWHWGPAEDTPVLRERSTPPRTRPWEPVTRAAAELAAQARCAPRVGPRLSPAVPTVVVVHALTGDARAGGAGGWWEPLIGPGLPIDPSEARVLCFNLLGSCYGTSGPGDGSFPRLADDKHPAELTPARGGFQVPAVDLPATVTTWDQARSILLALDALGVERVELVTGGSLGGMVALALAALDPLRFARVVPIAACAAASSWILAFNHVGRQAILADPGFPDRVERGLELARQLAMITYRAEPGLERTQGRKQGLWTETVETWSSRARYRIQTYLEHQGQKLVARFHAPAYLALIGAMDHHDLARAPSPPDGVESWPATVGPPPAAFASLAVATAPRAPRPVSWGLDRIRAATFALSIDSDQLYLPSHSAALVLELGARGVPARHATISSAHGHDAFLIEWEQLDAHLRVALGLPGSRRRWDPRNAGLPGVVRATV
ncbi:MAG TPA: alpha/beta fold hydrolase [Kofleriaceae bacterium]|jgi:homoserine O-acetyltransferase|nr:alpha/beta fold hydrolase [Kofleriaceae bacterium]